MAISSYLAKVWSVTDFGDSELSEYAEAQLCKDTRLGVQVMAGLSLAMQVLVAVAALLKGIGNPYLYISVLFGLLSLHVLVSAAYLKDVRTLQVLGMAFLIIGALCLTSLAHQAGELHIGIMAATVLMFVAVPLVPWALRETSVVIGLSYLLLTSSLIAVPGRFDTESLWILQLLVLGAAVIVLVIAGRNTFIRKEDLKARFDLESAHEEMQMLSMQDHLTGAWNRRFLSENFDKFAKDCFDKNKTMHVAILDIDDFKGINDEFGHQFGDKILMNVADIFVRRLGADGRLIRLGGDEFQIISCGSDLDEVIEAAIAELQQKFSETGLSDERRISISAGIVSSPPGRVADLEGLYKAADNALYAVKHNRAVGRDNDKALTRTGKWKL